MATANRVVTNILQKIFFYVQMKKETPLHAQKVEGE